MLRPFRAARVSRLGRWLPAVGVLLLASACATATDSAAYVPEGAQEPVVAPLPDPSWDAAAVGQTLDTTLAVGLPDPTGILDAFKATWEGSDGRCPPRMGDYNMVLYVATCTAGTGWTFAGVSIYQPAGGPDFWMLGDGWVKDPQGNTFILAGEIERETTEAGWEASVRGTWTYPAAEADWLVGTTGAALWMVADADGLHLDGGYAQAGVDVSFESVTVSDTCTSGVVWLHDPAGAWYTVDLGDDCDACGEVAYAGEPLGQVCLDLATPAADLLTRMEG